MDAFHYEEVALSEMSVDGNLLRYPCPCGDLFELPLEEFAGGADVAQCPTCSLTLRIICSEAERKEFLRKYAVGGDVLCAVST
ncbi:diphthamide biosynthesis protein 3 [Trypanosoma grayi]|uniref:diphthamide biosynthesis protein 3 n=1 Tax=Trypanosoma grayi TaxID=71804 RepID=UPI0004F4A69E|nr:diphthamide biosynthesis protein 3 [Trypanosoma grayi]KEG12567.1 diphthamide biosynthesis protein 3 [Trypanosoma grayi]